MNEFEPLEPARAVRMYLEARQDELTDWALKPHKYRLRVLVEWCEESGVGDLTELGGRGLYEFRAQKRKGNFDVKDGEAPEEVVSVTFKSWLATLWAFLRPAANTHVILKDFYERVPLPKLSGADDVSNSTLKPDRAVDVPEYLRHHHYASRRYVEFALPWETGAWMGAIRGPDLRDLDLDGRTPVVRHEHRPDQGIPIKNGEKGERFNSVSDRVGTMLQAYTDGLHVDKTDKFGQKPLLTTPHGWVSAGTIRQDAYVVTRSCWLNQGYPHNQDIETRKAVELSYVSTCPSSWPPHDARKEAATLYWREEVPCWVVSDYFDASDLVLDRHYDRCGERERAEQQRNHLPRQNNEYSTYPNARSGLYTSSTEPL